MIKSVLVPFDGSRCSRAALSIAGSISGIVGAQLVGLFVDDISKYGKIDASTLFLSSVTGQPAVPTPKAPKEVLRIQEEFVKRHAELEQVFKQVCAPDSVHGRFAARVGDPVEEIVEMAKTVDFVMIGHDDKEVETSSGKPGTTTSELLHSTTRPVLVVPDEPRGEEKILIAYDKSDASARALRAAAELAEIADFGEVHLLTVDMDEDEGIEIQSSAAQYLSSYDLDVVPVVRAGTPSVVIREYAEDIDASVITLGAFGHVRLHQRIFGSTTNDVLSNMDRAVLIMA